MFWIILACIFIGLLVIAALNDVDTDLGGVLLGGVVISALIFTATCIEGMTDYRCLKGKLATIEALQARMQDVKDSVYTYEKDGNFVAGSVENMNQSTNLSQYITALAEKEGFYLKYLQRCIVTKETFILSFFGSGWAISNKIYDLPTTFVK